MTDPKDDPEVEVLPAQAMSVVSPTLASATAAADGVRLSVEESAVALIQGEPGAGWLVFRDICEHTAIIAFAMKMFGSKQDTIQHALAGALALEAFYIAQVSSALRRNRRR